MVTNHLLCLYRWVISYNYDCYDYDYIILYPSDKYHYHMIILKLWLWITTMFFLIVNLWLSMNNYNISLLKKKTISWSWFPYLLVPINDDTLETNGLLPHPGLGPKMAEPEVILWDNGRSHHGDNNGHL